MLLIDVKAAFGNGELHETIYMEQPEGYLVKGKESKICLHSKALYRLKQASRACYKVIATFLVFLGCTRSSADPSCTISNLMKLISTF